MRLTALFSHLAGLRLAALTATVGQLTLHLHPTTRSAHCPLCHRHSRQVHSPYLRTLADLPWAGLSVTLCPRPPLCLRQSALSPARLCRASPRPRRPLHTANRAATRRPATDRHGARRQPGQGQALPLGIPPSRATLLRLVRATPVTPGTAPHVVGIDEWAWCRSGPALDQTRFSLIPLFSLRQYAPWRWADLMLCDHTTPTRQRWLSLALLDPEVRCGGSVGHEACDESAAA